MPSERKYRSEKRPSPASGKGKGRGQGAKGDATRRRILKAARDVFTGTAYQAAGLRTIAEKAGVRHPLVLHYFHSKNALFEAVAEQVQQEILEEHPRFFNRLQHLGTDKRKSVYLEGILRQGLRRPDAYRLMLLNAVGAVAPDDPLPGLERMIRIHEKILALVGEYVLEQAPAGETAMFMLVFTLAAVHFIGGRAFHQKTLGLNDEDYEDWVHHTLTRLFIPALDALDGRRLTVQVVNTVPEATQNRQDQNINAPGPRAPETKPMPRGEITKNKIIDAARQVFAICPYDSATIRHIGSVGKFDFSRIHHFFPTKAALFEAVIRDRFDQFISTIDSWRQGLEGLPPEDVFVHYLRQGLTYCFENRETVGMLVINIAHYENHRDSRGFNFMSRVHAGMLDMVRQSAPPQVPAEAVSQWLYTIVMMGYTFAGAPIYPAGIMGLDPDSEDYRRRVFETLYRVFLPSLLERTGKSVNPDPCNTGQ